MSMRWLCIFLLLSELVLATTYYVDGTASGTNDGSSWTNAWLNLSSAGAVVDGGDYVLVSDAATYGGEDDATQAALNCDNAGSLAAPNIYIGCTGTGDESSYVAAQVTVDVSSDNIDYVVIPVAHTKFFNFIFRGHDEYGVYGSAVDGVALHNCLIYPEDGDGNQWGVLLDDDCSLTKCEIYGHASGGVQADVNVSLDGCKIHDNTGYNVTLQGGTVSNCIFYGTVTASHLRWETDQESLTVNCTFDGEADSDAVCVHWDSEALTKPPVVINNIFHDADYGLVCDTDHGSFGAHVFNNLFNSMSTGNVSQIGTGLNAIIDSDPAFVNESGHDYTLTADSPAVDTGVDGIRDLGACEYVGGGNVIGDGGYLW